MISNGKINQRDSLGRRDGFWMVFHYRKNMIWWEGWYDNGLAEGEYIEYEY